MSVPRFYVSNLDPASGVVALPADEARHATKVLRLRAGDEVVVFDGHGREWTARLGVPARGGVAVALVREVLPVPEPSVSITLAVALLKGDQMDAVVRDATMMGARSIVPMTTAHVTVAERMWQGGGSIARWQRVAVASAKQCRRAVVPVVGEVAPFERVVTAARSVGPDDPLIVMCVEPGIAGAQSVREIAGVRPRAVVVLIGPEGGWASDEVAHAVSAGARLVHLGPRTLRAESTPAVVLSALWTLWGG